MIRVKQGLRRAQGSDLRVQRLSSSELQLLLPGLWPESYIPFAYLGIQSRERNRLRPKYLPIRFWGLPYYNYSRTYPKTLNPKP